MKKKNIKKVDRNSENQKDVSFDFIMQSVDKTTKRYIDISFDIADILKSYKKTNSLSQKELAEKINKKESELSKWFSGTHNFTIKTIAKIEQLIGRKILFLENDVLFLNQNKIIVKSTNAIVLSQSSESEIEHIGQITTFKIQKDFQSTLISQNIN